MIYQLVLAFFGLTPIYKNNLLEEIHTLCYHGNGGFTHDEVYNMSIRYRHYHIKKINEFIEKQAESINGKSENSETTTLPDQIQVPDFATKVRAPKK